MKEKHLTSQTIFMRMISISSAENFSLFYNYSSFLLTCLSVESFLKPVGDNLRAFQLAGLWSQVEMPRGALAAQILALRVFRKKGAPFQELTSQFKKYSILLGRLVGKYAMKSPRKSRTHQLFQADAFSLGFSDARRVQNYIWTVLV